MGLFTPNKRATYRRFTYEPRFYNPEKDEKLRKRIRVGRQTRRRGPAGVIYFALILIVVLYMYITLS